MRFLLIILIIFTSCENKTETKFIKIPYDLRHNYLDSLGTKINPNKDFQYWQYSTFYQRYGEQNTNYTVLSQGGDTLLRKKISEKINPIKIVGIFQGGHPSYRCNYAITIENEKVNYIKSEDEFRTFLGDIDNLEEALLLAETYGYRLDVDGRANKYRKVENGYELHLMKFHEFPRSLEAVELKIGNDGTIKTKSLGIYKTKNVY